MTVEITQSEPVTKTMQIPTKIPTKNQSNQLLRKMLGDPKAYFAKGEDKWELQAITHTIQERMRYPLRTARSEGATHAQLAWAILVTIARREGFNLEWTGDRLEFIPYTRKTEVADGEQSLPQSAESVS